MSDPVILGIIPARGGSKGIPHKNIVQLGKKPLLRWTIDAARQSRRLTQFILSTDSQKIRRLGIAWGCSAPFLRPAALATDHAKTVDVIRHTVLWREKHTGTSVDAVLVLQPTAPFRSREDIDKAITLLAATPQADSVISFQRVSHGHPNYLYKEEGHWAKPYLGDKALGRPRQKMASFLMRNGAIYLIRRRALFSRHSWLGRKIMPYVMPAERSINIDDVYDLRVARGLLRVRA